MTTTPTNVRLGSTYRITVPFYALSDGTTLTDLDAPPTLQAYDIAGTTAIGSAVTCTRDSAGTYHGDLEISSPTFAVNTGYMWKMAGLSGTKAQDQTGYFVVMVVV